MGKGTKCEASFNKWVSAQKDMSKYARWFAAQFKMCYTAIHHNTNQMVCAACNPDNGASIAKAGHLEVKSTSAMVAACAPLMLFKQKFLTPLLDGMKDFAKDAKVK